MNESSESKALDVIKNISIRNFNIFYFIVKVNEMIFTMFVKKVNCVKHNTIILMRKYLNYNNDDYVFQNFDNDDGD